MADAVYDIRNLALRNYLYGAGDYCYAVAERQGLRNNGEQL